MLRLQRVAASAVAAATIMGTALAMTAPASADSRPSFIGQFSQLTSISSTVPQNGDQNPYGVAVVRHSHGRLIRGDVLVSNFNDMVNQQDKLSVNNNRPSDSVVRTIGEYIGGAPPPPAAQR